MHVTWYSASFQQWPLGLAQALWRRWRCLPTCFIFFFISFLFHSFWPLHLLPQAPLADVIFCHLYNYVVFATSNISLIYFEEWSLQAHKEAFYPLEIWYQKSEKAKYDWMCFPWQYLYRVWTYESNCRYSYHWRGRGTKIIRDDWRGNRTRI